MNGWVVDILKSHGREAPMNKLVVDMGFEIESGSREYHVDNAKDLIAAYKKITAGS